MSGSTYSKKLRSGPKNASVVTSTAATRHLISVSCVSCYYKDPLNNFSFCYNLFFSQTNGGVVSGGLAENGLGIPGNHKLRGSLRYTTEVRESEYSTVHCTENQ